MKKLTDKRSKLALASISDTASDKPSIVIILLSIG